MKKTKITTRKKDILKRLCSEHDYITIASIAEDIGVSSRTILRELKEIGEWLKEKDVSLNKKTGVGIILNCSLEKKEQLLELIDHESLTKTFTPSERQMIIASELLQKNQPIKLYYLTKIINVSEGTISNDLNKLEKWLNIYNLELIRKPGLGVYIQGQERHKRRAIVNLIYENVEEKQLLNLIQNNITKSPETSGNIEIKTRNRLLNLIDKETIRRLEELIYQAEEDIGYELAESAYVGLIVHLALAIKRIKNNEKIVINQEFLKELRKNPEFLTAKKISTNISNLFNIEIKDDEVGYITMHLMGSKVRGNAYNIEDTAINNYELVKMAREIIQVAEEETGRFLKNNENLLMGLVNHLEPALKRLKMKMDIRNPLLKKIKSTYPHLLKISKKAVKGVEDYIGEPLPESEIAYIAMHLGAVIEKKEILPPLRLRVAVACPSGIGASRLLAARIGKEYEYIQVIDVISTLHIEEGWLKQQEIDFIISTISIEKFDIPVIIVNPLLLEEDKKKINELIKKLKIKSMKSKKKNTKTKLSFKDKLLQMHQYSEGIIQILDKFFLETLSVNDVEELIDFISSKVMQDKTLQEQLKQDLLSREMKGETLILEKGFRLLHCRSESVEELYFGAIRLINSLYYMDGKGEKKEINLVIVMLAPKNSTQAQLEVISEISKMMINSPTFLNQLKKGAKEQAYREINNWLQEFYQCKNK